MTDATRLLELLDAEHAATAALAEAIEGTHADLANDSPDLLLAASGRLGQLTGALAEAERMRSETFEALRSGDESWESVLERQGDARLTRRWSEITSLLQRCRERNAVNGGIVELQLHHVRRALDVLQGRAPDGDTYGRRGETRRGPAQHCLATA